MHIALLRRRVSGPGGAEATLIRLARGFAQAGRRVTILAETDNANALRHLGPGVQVRRVPVWGGKTGRLLSYALNSRRVAAACGAEVVFSLERVFNPHVYRAGDGVHREWLARQGATLPAATRLARAVRPFHRVMLWLEKRLFASPELTWVIANSRMVQGDILRHFPLSPEKIRVIYNGLDHQEFALRPGAERRELRSRLGGNGAAPVVLFVGSGFERKGLAYLLESFSRLKDKKAELWVVGKGRIPRYEALAANLGISPRVRFFGPRREVAPFYQAASLLALPTLYDPLSNAVLEALACGCPVITTSANGAAEFITPGENGEVLPRAEDPRTWAETLAVWTERDREEQVHEAAARAVAHLSWDATVTLTLEVLEDAISHRRG
jgi:UDP-glucose:(heptosyl)LPS alpha-1,3-glucosyltransferase